MYMFFIYLHIDKQMMNIITSRKVLEDFIKKLKEKRYYENTNYKLIFAAI